MKSTNSIGSRAAPKNATNSTRAAPKHYQQRRRLTILGQTGEPLVPEPAVAPSAGSATTVNTPEQARALIKNLKETDVLGLVGANDTQAAGNDTTCRRLSLSTVTDVSAAARRRSFLEKGATVEGVGSQQSAVDSLAAIGIGTACKKGKKPESPNQDSFSVVIVEDKFKLYAVLDGHGASGHHVSNFCRDSIVKLFLRHPNRDEETEKALVHAFTETQKVLEIQNRSKDADRIDCTASGTTCTVVYQPIHVKPPSLIVAHVGDSRAILARKRDRKFLVTDLTEDHKPNLPAEKERIEKAGGTVAFDGHFNYRIFTKDGQGGLNMSRALGDLTVSKVGLSAEPETCTVPISVSKIELEEEDFKDDIMLILCSDGVWEFIESEEAAKIVGQFGRSQVQEATERLAKTSWERWMSDSGDEISDDITAIVAYLP